MAAMLDGYQFNVAEIRPAKSPRDNAPILLGRACVNLRSLFSCARSQGNDSVDTALNVAPQATGATPAKDGGAGTNCSLIRISRMAYRATS